ncbi:hypothetical protein SAMN05660662_1671 [Blastococcus aurantiacus]|uniref:Uncharacterized protein n=1 Tax=Blastococcus aurantiacus TaxID=1550231 RepID=A0A1G7JRF1_9ACTN|nr:hypothetical protein [Blastococcus aurantiacus]SDF27493.1 hypothetical protein SAMN05660662_1671 [Blastococcus aurantiacus]
MAISVFDVRDTFARPRLVLPSRRTVAPGTTFRHAPVPALLAGLAGIVQAVALLAVALHGLDAALTAPSRPAGPAVALGLLGLAAWIVLVAAGGAAVIDGSGRRLLTGVAVAELGLVAAAAVLLPATPVALPSGLSLPVLLALAAALPVAKLLLAGSPSAVAWVAAGPRPAERRPDPATTHRVLATATLALIGLALGAVALLGPVENPVRTGETASTTVYQP